MTAIVLEYFPAVWALKSGFKCANCQRVTLGKIPSSPPWQYVKAGMPLASTHATDFYWAPTVGKCWRQGGDLAIQSQVYAHHVSLSDVLHSTYHYLKYCLLSCLPSLESKIYGEQGLVWLVHSLPLAGHAQAYYALTQYKGQGAMGTSTEVPTVPWRLHFGEGEREVP